MYVQREMDSVGDGAPFRCSDAHEAKEVRLWLKNSLDLPNSFRISAAHGASALAFSFTSPCNCSVSGLPTGPTVCVPVAPIDLIQ